MHRADAAGAESVATDRPQELVAPARARTIGASFAVAFAANLLPWPSVAVVPDFVALLVVFWCVREPLRVGLGAAWLLGLATDAANMTLLGQHALAYALLAFVAINLSRRILWFGAVGQALHVALLLFAAQAVGALVRFSAGAATPGPEILAGPVLGALAWPALAPLLLAPQRRAAEVPEAR